MSRMFERASYPWRQRGIAALEFAIALPALLLLMLATVEFGRALSQYNTLTKTTRDGVRYLAGEVLHGTTGTFAITDQLRSTTQNLVVYGNPGGGPDPVLEGLTTGDVEIVGSEADGTVTVNVAYPYQAMIGAVMPMFGYGPDQSLVFTLQASVVMRAL